MAPAAAIALADDFKEVIRLLADRGFVPEKPDPAMLSLAKAIHTDTHALILWRFRIKGLPVHGKVFLDEIASDALQILPQVVLGFSKTAKLLVRGIVENALRHVYFTDHPVEFERMNRDMKWYLSFDDLIGYARLHPSIGKAEAGFDALAKLSSLYSELSAGVHGRAVRDLEMRRALTKIAFSEEVAKRDAEAIRRCTQAVNFLLSIFHWDRVKQMQLADRSLIMRSMPVAARKAWVNHQA